MLTARHESAVKSASRRRGRSRRSSVRRRWLLWGRRKKRLSLSLSFSVHHPISLFSEEDFNRPRPPNSLLSPSKAKQVGRLIISRLREHAFSVWGRSLTGCRCCWSPTPRRRNERFAQQTTHWLRRLENQVVAKRCNEGGNERERVKEGKKIQAAEQWNPSRKRQLKRCKSSNFCAFSDRISRLALNSNWEKWEKKKNFLAQKSLSFTAHFSGHPMNRKSDRIVFFYLLIPRRWKKVRVVLCMYFYLKIC